MHKFGFILHTTDLNLFSIAINEPNLTKKRRKLVEQVFTWLSPFNVSKITGVHSLTGKEIEGFFIYCALLPEQLLNLDPNFVLKKIVEGGKIAENLGAEILGLGAYAAQVGRKGLLVAKNLKIPVTTGTSYTIAVVIEAIVKASQEIGIDLKKAKIAIVGASGSIGSTIANILVDKASNLMLVGRNRDKLELISVELFKKNKKISITIENNIENAVKNTDIIIVSTTTPDTLINIDDLKSGALICDISQPRNVSQKAAFSRNDILVIDGGVVEVPGDVNFNFYFGLPSRLTYACIAETMILTLEEIFESYSIGGNISLMKVLKIEQLARKHGFSLSNLRSFGQDVTEKQIKNFKENIAIKRKL